MLLHLGTAQVEIAVLEADFLGGRVAVGYLKRHRRRRAQRLERANRNFDFAGRQLRVDSSLGAAHDLALHGDVELGAHVAGGLMRRGIVRGIKDKLEDSVAVAKVDED